MSPVLQLLRDLVALPSVNPAFAGGHDTLAGEQRVADFLTALAARAGLEVEQRAVAPGRPNLLVRLSPERRVRHRLILAPHLDTVGGVELPGRLFDPVIRNGRLHGRGACDTKGSVAAMFSALLRLSEGRRPTHTEVLFAGLMDEENAQAGSRALTRERWRADLAVVGEPTRARLVTAHKGDLWLELRTRGRPAHGATPHLGRNAVHAMARVVDLLETRYAAALTRRRHPLLGHPTVNVGVVQGGTQPNVVPGACRIQIDRRTLPGETEAGVRREIRAWLARSGLRAVIANAKAAPCPALDTGVEHPWIATFLHQLGQEGPRGVDYFCDAAVLAAGGIPSVVFGPGDIAQAHTEDEWVSVTAVDAAAQRLLSFLQTLP